jgi:hypothetical protein
MITVYDSRNRGHFVREKPHVQLGIALLDHASKQSGGVDATRRFVNGTPIAPDFLLVAGYALVLGNQLLA